MRPSTADTLVTVAPDLWRLAQDGGRDAQNARRLAAKRNNHRVMLLATTVNTVTLTIFGAAFITPHFTGAVRGAYFVWIVVALGLHLVAQGLYEFLRAGD